MNFLEKNALYIKHNNADHLESDRKLLEELNPKSPVLKTKYFSREKEAGDILRALLECTTEDEIVSNREGKRISGADKKKAQVPMAPKSKGKAKARKAKVQKVKETKKK